MCINDLGEETKSIRLLISDYFIYKSTTDYFIWRHIGSRLYPVVIRLALHIYHLHSTYLASLILANGVDKSSFCSSLLICPDSQRTAHLYCCAESYSYYAAGASVGFVFCVS